MEGTTERERGWDEMLWHLFMEEGTGWREALAAKTKRCSESGSSGAPGWRSF